MPKKMHITTLNAQVTDYARQLIAQKAARAAAAQPSPLVAGPAEDWIGTAEAATLSGYSQRRIHALCDEGFFVAGVDWKQRPPMKGFRNGGFIKLRRSALKKLEGS
jgi:hypothetical protein